MKTIYPFPVLVLLLMVLCSCSETPKKKTVFTNGLKNTQWIINSGGIILPDGPKEYVLSKRDSTFRTNIQEVDFVDEEKFISYDSWECGNDCFTKVHGSYAFIAKDIVEMKVDSMAKSGTCEAPTQLFKPAKTMRFDLIKEENLLKLIRK